MFGFSNTPDWFKRATDIANSMDLGNDLATDYDSTKSRLQTRKADMEQNWGADPAWDKTSDDMKTGMTLAVDAADGTENTEGLFSLAQDWNKESNLTARAQKQKKVANKAATLVGKKPKSDQQSKDFAGITWNITNDRYSGHETGKEWAKNHAGDFTGTNSLHAPTNTAPGSTEDKPYDRHIPDLSGWNLNLQTAADTPQNPTKPEPTDSTLAQGIANIAASLLSGNRDNEQAQSPQLANAAEQATPNEMTNLNVQSKTGLTFPLDQGRFHG